VAIDREKILVLAQKYVEKKRYDRAVVEYQKVIEEDPNDARTLLKIGDLQSKMEEYAGAVGTYERVGRFYASQGFSLKAIAVYKQIREIITKHVPHLEEKYANVTPKLAELYQQLGLTSDALAALDEVATRLQRQGREPEAIEVFRRIAELDPTNPLPHLRLAEALSRSKDADGAVAEFSIAAGQLTKLGRREDALKVIERLLQHRPDAAHARAAAELYLARNAANDGLQALAKLQICFQANPRDLDTLALLARAFNHIGQAAKAIEVQKEMARIARDSGKTELFQEILERLLKLVPNDEAVRQLASAPAGTSSAPPPQAPGRVTASALPANVSRRESPRDSGSTTATQRVGEPFGASAEDADRDEGSYEDVGESEIDDADPGAGSEGDDTDVVVVETEMARPSELSAEVREQLAQALSDAASFRRARLPAKAVATLRAAIRAQPRSLELREVLRDVLLEAGRESEAAAELLEIAELQIEALDADEALRTLQDVLAIEPRNARAIEMVRALGYELVEEPAPPDSTTQQTEMQSAQETTDRDSYEDGPGGGPQRPGVGAEDPLPSYDLEEIGPEDVAQRAYAEPSARGAAAARTGRVDESAPAFAQPRRQYLVNDVDDPFGEGPLPSFPLEGPTETSPRAPPRRGTAELESALEEAEFFVTRGLYDDARAILDEQLARLPNHPLLLERLAELNEQEQGVQVGSGTRPSPAAEGVEDRAFDIAESLGALDGDPTSGVGSGARGARMDAPTEQVDVEEVFAKFKEGVARQIGADDAQSHYDLGVAYQAMGLFDDAIREFETAAQDDRRACVCHSMIGMIYLERGNINEAIDSLLRGLEAPERTKEQEASLSYELGAAYEAKKMNKQALESFQRAARLIPTFRDVAERVRRLQKVEPKQPSRAVAVGADDEFDRAFEGILGKGE
jgi:tetratricopeptide (TPR) repeat protein